MTLPVLYILMRNDLDSMNPGKAIAQGSHAANAFVHHFHAYSQEANTRPVNSGVCGASIKAFAEWERSTTQGFGTVLTLEGKMADIASTVTIFKALGYVAGVIHDPTYPIVDGDVVHHIPLDTCAYIFVPDKETDPVVKPLAGQYKLHR
jgi:hypothetical protein